MHWIERKLRDILKNQMASNPKMDEVAKAMGMSGRTLRRRLTSIGTSYQNELDHVRQELALSAMEEAKSLASIAEGLGFNDSSAFYKAFRRWTGMTPSEYMRWRSVGNGFSFSA